MPQIDLSGTGVKETDAAALSDIAGLSADSRAVRPGFLFAAITGAKEDGRRFIPEALAAGASVVLAMPGTQLPAGVSARLVTSDAPRRTLALLAARFYGAQPETVVAVTGTNGKTSTVHFCRQLWEALGARAASIGTLGLLGPGIAREGGAWITTPDPVTLHEGLAELARAGVTHLAMEASSHGLVQHRMDGVRIAAAGFTNFTRDHLDMHGTMEAYFAAKVRLFSELLPPGAAAVLNADIPEFEMLRDLCSRRGHRVLSYGAKGADFTLLSAMPQTGGLHVALRAFGREHAALLPLAGDFQAMNALCALALCAAEAPDDTARMERLVAALGRLQAPPGRGQRIGVSPRGGVVYVDYAHTPDGLETILRALRGHVGPGGRLVCVFGCGGDRDPGKRPIMGKISSRMADISIVTDDNPRGEDPAAIRRAILTAAPGTIDGGDRRAAIRRAVALLGSGDVLVVAGKGHERGQIIGGVTHPFDDAGEIRAALAQAEGDTPGGKGKAAS